MVILPAEDWQKLKEEIEKISSYIYNYKEKEQSKWLTSEEARKILNVSKRTWQTYRNRRLLPFSQVGKKVLVKKCDLEEFINSKQIKRIL